MNEVFADAAMVAAVLAPEQPVYCLRPHVLRAQAAAFVAGFPGKVLYAVKCNAELPVLRALHAGGIRHFDTASLTEITLVAGAFADARCYFMHPVKPRGAIRQAFERHGIRHFVVDHADELEKIGGEITRRDDTVIVVRLATARGAAVYDLGGKFGCPPDEAAVLLNAAARAGFRVGLCFHVGSQCLDPSAYGRALALAGTVIERGAVPLSLLDVGGGFPAAYVGVEPPPLSLFIQAIRDGAAALDLPAECALMCEPGRGLVAAGASLLVRVELRRGNALYINDGVYGSLSDLNIPGTRFPMRVIRPGGTPADETGDFALFGPTCDTVDAMPGPFRLAADVREGDYIEIGQAGAYTTALRTRFNGFHPERFVEVRDPAFLPAMPAHATAVVAA